MQLDNSSVSPNKVPDLNESKQDNGNSVWVDVTITSPFSSISQKQLWTLEGSSKKASCSAFPAHRRNSADLFWLEEMSGQEDNCPLTTPVSRQVARFKSPGAAAQAAVASATLTQARTKPVLLSASEAARAGSQTGWRLRSLEKN